MSRVDCEHDDLWTSDVMMFIAESEVFLAQRAEGHCPACEGRMRSEDYEAAVEAHARHCGR